jgi:uncharacterized protein YjbI with pentapeptide repeats
LNFSRRNLTDAVLAGSALIQADLSGTILRPREFFRLRPAPGNMEGASLVKADLAASVPVVHAFNNADMLQADLREGQVLTHQRTGDLQSLYVDVPPPDTHGRTDFSKAKMAHASLNEVNAGRTDFSEADMQSVRMRNAQLRGANFEGANMEQSDFTGADLTGSNMRNAVILGAHFEGALTDNMKTEGALQDGQIKDISTIEKSINELITAHNQWVETAGREGSYLRLERLRSAQRADP